MTPRLQDSGLFAGPGEAEEFIDTLLDSSTEHSLIATDSAGVILLWNEGARRLYGYEPAEIVGQAWTMLHTEADVLAGLPDAMAGGACGTASGRARCSASAGTARSSPHAW